jgi:hypothetical protein
MMSFITAAGKGFRLNSRQYRNIAWALHDGQIAEGRLLAGEPEIPYHRYRSKRLSGGPVSQAKYAIQVGRSAQKELDRMDRLAFARLDRVILGLGERPTPRGCLKLKWLLPELRIVRGAESVVTIAIDREGRRVRLLKITYHGRRPTIGPKRPALPKRTATDIPVDAIEAIQDRAGRRGRLSKSERTVLAVGRLDLTMVTDGFDAFFRYSPEFASTIVDALLCIGCKRLAGIAQRALDGLNLTSTSTARVRAAMQKADRARDERLEKCSEAYWRASGPTRRLTRFIRVNRDLIRF